jgi:hypothetical protein
MGGVVSVLPPQFAEHQGVEAVIRHARNRCWPPSGERRADCPVVVVSAGSAAYRGDPRTLSVVGVALGPVADHYRAGRCCEGSSVLGEGFPDGRAVPNARFADPDVLAGSCGNVVWRSDADRHRTQHVPVGAQLSPDHELGPRMAIVYLDGQSADMSGIIILQRRRHPEVTVEGATLAVVVQGVEKAFGPAYRAAKPPVPGTSGDMADNHARCRTKPSSLARAITRA